MRAEELAKKLADGVDVKYPADGDRMAAKFYVNGCVVYVIELNQEGEKRE